MDETPAELPEYEVVVVGGGPAGLSAAMYTTRLGHRTAVIDRGGGRAAMMLDTHNLIGVPESVSGNEFLATAREELQRYGTEFHRALVTGISRDPGEEVRFRVEAGDATVLAQRVVLATGFTDGRPDPPVPRTGRGLHYCLHCDAYMFVDESVYVMGHGESAARVAMIMLNFTDEVDLLLRGAEPTWSEVTDRQLDAHPVDIVEAEIAGMVKDTQDPTWLGGFEFADGTVREYRGGFAMYGSNYSSGLAADLGCELNDDGTIAVGDHGRTSVDGIYAVGDVTPGHKQIPVAIGEGAKAGLSIHYGLRRFPRSLADIEAEGPVTAADVPAIAPEVAAAARTFGADGD